MAMLTAEPASGRAYAALEERILARDQVGASNVYYDLVRAGRPLAELLRETVRIHAPYTHVPYHQRLDDGMVKFVNNDHCLLSARVCIKLKDLVEPELAWLPLAQTIWYIPTGLDPWNQLIGKMPGHYVRLYELKVDGTPPRPETHWADQQPRYLEGGTFDEQLNEWLTLVQRGEVVEAYRVFLGLYENRPRREELLGQLMFAGLIDVQDRMLFARSYTTGHKSYRARATIELARCVGLDRAGPIIYAGVPDLAVGPRWYSGYELGCIVTRDLLDSRDQEYLANNRPLTRAEREGLIEAILSGDEPGYIYTLVELIKAGAGHKQLLDVIQLASAQCVLDTGHQNDYSMPQHSFEYCNGLRWFYDNFAHRHRLKLLFVAAGFVNKTAHFLKHTPGNERVRFRAPRGTEALSRQQLLGRIDETIIGLRADESVALVQTYLTNGYEREPLIRVLATTAAKLGNDPHNQELGLSFLEDYARGTAPERDRLLLACAKHNAGHRKYGDPLEAYRRFAEQFGIATRQEARGDGPVEEALLDD